jgi:acetoin utilization deacetylase AcuC-like enzyme
MLKIAYNDYYIQPLPSGHRFPMEKYDLLPRQLLHEGTIDSDNIFSPGVIDQRHVLAVHDTDYFLRLTTLKLSPREQRVSGFPHDGRLILREQIIMEGTRRCAEYALNHGVAMNVAGGTHHAYQDRGEGFCLLNDHAIAAMWLLNEQKVKRILIIDLDVHQGNGTAAIFAQDDRVFTFSMHGKNNYPLHKEVSNCDVELEDGINDQEYLYLLEKNLDTIMQQFEPEFIFFQSGVDIIDSDKLGRLGVSLQGCRRRDEVVFQTAKSANIPIVACMGGGYSADIRKIIEAHANTYRVAQAMFF